MESEHGQNQSEESRALAWAAVQAGKLRIMTLINRPVQAQ